MSTKKESTNQVPEDISPVVFSSTFKRPINQFSLEGKYIKTFPSLTAAAVDCKSTIANVSRCCKGKQKQCKGYQWRYAVEK
jgi:hypothetical protein